MNKIKELLGTGSDDEIIHKNEYVTTKINSFNNEIKSDFHDEESPSEPTLCSTYMLVLIESVYKSDKVFILKYF